MQTLFAESLPSQLRRIGGMATMPSRADSLAAAVETILPQVDHLYVYFDKHRSVPAAYADHPRITALLPGDEDLAGSGKFLGLRLQRDPCLYFCFDDDILYPPGYTDHLAAALRRLGYRVLVGIHGACFRHPVRSYARDREILHFRADLRLDCVVDELGTGTLAFHSSCIDIDPARWAYRGMDDIMVMLEAVRQEVPRIAVRRPRSFLAAIAENQADSVWLQTRKDDSVQTRLVQGAIAHYPGRWCTGP